jgi:hypothetical protein
LDEPPAFVIIGGADGAAAFESVAKFAGDVFGIALAAAGGTYTRESFSLNHVCHSSLQYCGVFATMYTLKIEIATSRRFRYGEVILSPAQCRMARAALQLGVRELAEAAKVSTNTITRFEKGDDLKERTVDAIRAALENAGIEFINGTGVKLRSPTS